MVLGAAASGFHSGKGHLRADGNSGPQRHSAARISRPARRELRQRRRVQSWSPHETIFPMGTIRIGISGWRYEPWRGIFYPKGLAQRRELEFASRAFNSIELNGSFYALQTPRSYETWHDESPDGFVFSIKGPRYITHIRRLKDIEGPLANFFASGIFNLREKIGPFLWQFPPSLRYDEERFEKFCSMLPHDTEKALALAGRR